MPGICQVKILKEYDLKYNKIASALLTYTELLESVASEGKHTFISTGMSTMEEIDKGGNLEMLNVRSSYDCNSTYPMKNDAANLNVMRTLKEYFNCDVGYMGMRPDAAGFISGMYFRC